jgi:hypothetical protein
VRTVARSVASVSFSSVHDQKVDQYNLSVGPSIHLVLVRCRPGNSIDWVTNLYRQSVGDKEKAAPRWMPRIR